MKTLFTHPEDTYLVRYSGLVLAIDRAARTHHGDLVIVKLNSQMMLTQLNLRDGDERIDFEVWGKVAYIICEV